MIQSYLKSVSINPHYQIPIDCQLSPSFTDYQCFSYGCNLYIQYLYSPVAVGCSYNPIVSLIKSVHSVVAWLMFL